MNGDMYAHPGQLVPLQQALSQPNHYALVTERFGSDILQHTIISGGVIIPVTETLEVDDGLLKFASSVQVRHPEITIGGSFTHTTAQVVQVVLTSRTIHDHLSHYSNIVRNPLATVARTLFDYMEHHGLTTANLRIHDEQLASMLDRLLELTRLEELTHSHEDY